MYHIYILQPLPQETNLDLKGQNCGMVWPSTARAWHRFHSKFSWRHVPMRKIAIPLIKDHEILYRHPS